MKYDEILLLANKFYKYSEAYTLTDIVQHLQSIKSFANRLKYCSANFKRLGAGTARVAFLLPDGKVLKLAKNAKGIAQNNTESDYGLQNGITNKIIASDEQHWWLITNLASKVNAAFFKSQTGLSFETYCKVLNYWDHIQHNRLKYDATNELQKILDQNQFVQDVTEIIGNANLGLGDFLRLSSYGNVAGELKVIDFGITMEDWEKYYKR